MNTLHANTHSMLRKLKDLATTDITNCFEELSFLGKIFINDFIKWLRQLDYH